MNLSSIVNNCIKTCFNCDLVNWFIDDLVFLVLFFVLADASAAKSLKLINWFENNILPNEEAAKLDCFLPPWSIKLIWLLKKWFALDDEVVDVDDETEEDSKAAGVNNNGNVVGDKSGSLDVDDFDEVDDVDDDLDEREDSVDATDDDEWFDEEDEHWFLLLNVKWFGRNTKLEPDESPK